MASTSLKFNVTRQTPELVRPAEPTPREYKPLSDIDDNESLRFQIPLVQFYRRNPSQLDGIHPAKVIKDALAKTLVFYYPLAGRLREGHNRKLFVDCTGDGVLFIEADADVALEQFGDELQPPFPCMEELLYDVPGSGGILHCPLLLIQVTRLSCGGFIFAIRLNHTMSDAIGLVQFMKAMAKIARGSTTPPILPVWRRELLNARHPPRITCNHHEFDEVAVAATNHAASVVPLHSMATKSFFFGPSEMSALQRLVLPKKFSKFEVLTACLWRCRSVAIRPNPSDEVRVIILRNVRSMFNPHLPSGYYSNGIVFPAAVSTAGWLCRNPLENGAELIRKARADVTEEYVKSVADLNVIRGRPHFTTLGTFVLSNLEHIGFRDVDFGWGKAVYAGVLKSSVGSIPGPISFCVPTKNKKGEEGVAVSISLPPHEMEIFERELQVMLNHGNPSISIKSSL